MKTKTLILDIMNVDNAKSQMRKGMLEYCVLLLLSREASYANDIIVRLKQAELIVVEGTLYPLLTRLKKTDCYRTNGENHAKDRLESTMH